MTTQSAYAPPPTTILSTKSISQSAAHGFLSAYLDRATTDPALQPNSFITEHGPVSRTTASAPNLTLHNLKRVQAGLAGEVLGRDLTLDKLDVDAEQGSGLESSNSKNATSNTDGWEDAHKWQQEAAGDDEGVDDGRDGTGQQTMDVDDETEAPAPATEGIDKEERKRKKKERRLAEKRSKADKPGGYS